MATVLAAAPLSQATAATSTANFTVTASVVTTCSVTANNLNFGSYAGTVLNVSTTVAATCSTGTPYTLGLNAGATTGATTTSRKMAGPGSDTLSYGLFQDAGHATNWGNAPGTDTEAGTGNGSAQSFTVFGQLPATQFVQSGSYSDTVTVTLTF